MEHEWDIAFITMDCIYLCLKCCNFKETENFYLAISPKLKYTRQHKSTASPKVDALNRIQAKRFQDILA